MTEIAIRTENISKKYNISAARSRHDTLREQMAAGLSSLFRSNGGAEKEYIWALKNVSLEIKRGELVGIIGSNGAGKSTLLKILSRITSATEGSAEIHGRVGSLLEVGTGFSHELTGRENVYLSGAILGMKKAEIDRKFDEIVNFSEVGKFIDTPVKRYSSGMYVRLAYAVSAHLEPEIMLLDEVLSVGDVAFQRKCIEHAKRLRDRNATILFVSHNMFSIKAMCRRVIYLSGGRVRFDGLPDHAIQLYEEENRSTASPWAPKELGPESSWSIRITDVKLFDADGEPKTMFDYGERMRIRVHYEATERIMNPNFIIVLIRSDKVILCNYNTYMDGFTMESVYGEGAIEVLTPPLKLVSDAYDISVLVRDASFDRLYCVHDTNASFHTRHDLLSNHFGVFHEDAEWNWLKQ